MESIYTKYCTSQPITPEEEACLLHEAFGSDCNASQLELTGNTATKYDALRAYDDQTKHHYTDSPDKQLPCIQEIRRALSTRGGAQAPQDIFERCVGGCIERSSVPLVTFHSYAEKCPEGDVFTPSLLEKQITAITTADIDLLSTLCILTNGIDLSEQDTYQLDMFLLRRDGVAGKRVFELLADWNYEKLHSLVTTYNLALTELAMTVNYRGVNSYNKPAKRQPFREYLIEQTIQRLESFLKITFSDDMRDKISGLCKQNERSQYLLSILPIDTPHTYKSMKPYWPKALTPFLQAIWLIASSEVDLQGNTIAFESLVRVIHTRITTRWKEAAGHPITEKYLFPPPSAISLLLPKNCSPADEQKVIVALDTALSIDDTFLQESLLEGVQNLNELLAIVAPPDKDYMLVAEHLLAAILANHNASPVRKALEQIKEAYPDDLLSIVTGPGFSSYNPSKFDNLQFLIRRELSKRRISTTSPGVSPRGMRHKRTPSDTPPDPASTLPDRKQVPLLTYYALGANLAHVLPLCKLDLDPQLQLRLFQIIHDLPNTFFSSARTPPHYTDSDATHESVFPFATSATSQPSFTTNNPKRCLTLLEQALPKEEWQDLSPKELITILSNIAYAIDAEPDASFLESIYTTISQDSNKLEILKHPNFSRITKPRIESIHTALKQLQLEPSATDIYRIAIDQNESLSALNKTVKLIQHTEQCLGQRLDSTTVITLILHCGKMSGEFDTEKFDRLYRLLIESKSYFPPLETAEAMRELLLSIPLNYARCDCLGAEVPSKITIALMRASGLSKEIAFGLSYLRTLIDPAEKFPPSAARFEFSPPPDTVSSLYGTNHHKGFFTVSHWELATDPLPQTLKIYKLGSPGTRITVCAIALPFSQQELKAEGGALLNMYECLLAPFSYSAGEAVTEDSFQNILTTSAHEIDSTTSVIDMWNDFKPPNGLTKQVIAQRFWSFFQTLRATTRILYTPPNTLAEISPEHAPITYFETDHTPYSMQRTFPKPYEEGETKHSLPSKAARQPARRGRIRRSSAPFIAFDGIPHSASPATPGEIAASPSPRRDRCKSLADLGIDSVEAPDEAVEAPKEDESVTMTYAIKKAHSSEKGKEPADFLPSEEITHSITLSSEIQSITWGYSDEQFKTDRIFYFLLSQQLTVLRSEIVKEAWPEGSIKSEL